MKKIVAVGVLALGLAGCTTTTVRTYGVVDYRSQVQTNPYHVITAPSYYSSYPRYLPQCRTVYGRDFYGRLVMRRSCY
jgi:hypothetical protein